MPTPVDDRTLEDIEGERCGDPAPDATFLVSRVHNLRRLPLRDLGVEDLRIMIGQSVGLPVLVPRALDLLADDPLAAGDYYPGDLLSAVLGHFDEWAPGVPDADRIVREVVVRIDDHDPDLTPNLAELIRRFGGPATA